MTALIVLAVIAAVVIFWAVGVYNGLVSKRERCKNGLAQIDVQLRRRYDLIPNLVETAKGYMKHEKETLEAVIKARNAAVSAAAGAREGGEASMAALSGAEGALAGALTKFMALSEAYPDLKANQNMMQLSEELTSTENKIAFARQGYNDEAQSYNTAVQQFPGSLVAGFGHFEKMGFLESVSAPEQREAVKVSF